MRKIAWQGLLAGVVCTAIFIAAVGTGIWWKRLHYEEGPSPKVSKEDEQLFDAVMYAFTGIEDNTKGSLIPWQRDAKPKVLEYWTIGKNGIGPHSFVRENWGGERHPHSFVRCGDI